MPSIKLQSHFASLRSGGQFVHVSHWLAINYKKNNSGSFNWAWTISRKVGSAVLRNKLKRWGREFVRDRNQESVDINFIFKVKNKDFYKSLTRTEFDEGFKRAFKKITNASWALWLFFRFHWARTIGFKILFPCSTVSVRFVYISSYSSSFYGTIL